MNFPIKYMEENLVFNVEGGVFAYYEWMPYNYSFVGESKALSIFNAIESVIAGSPCGDLHMLQISTNESIRDTIRRSKKEIQGELKGLAEERLDGIETYLVNIHGEYEVDYRYFIGFRLDANELEVNSDDMWSDLKESFKDAFRTANKVFFGDFTVVDNKEIRRYLKLERLLRSKISKPFEMRPLKPKDYAYIIQHLNGNMEMDYSAYHYNPALQIDEKHTKIKTYDIIKLTDAYIRAKERYLKIITDEKNQYVSYFTISDITGENIFPGNSEIFYYQQESFDFPVDVSMKIEMLENKDALSTLRNKKRELKDFDENAAESGNESSNNLVEARGDAGELEAKLEASKENMYKMSYVLRVSAESKEELSRRVMEVKDFYRSYNMILVRPFGDQLGLHEEFYPSTKRYMNDYMHYVTCEFMASLGFGAVRKLGEKEGIYLGCNAETGRSVFVKPWIAAQGIDGSITNALAKSFTGSLGGGKSFFMNLIALYTALYGGKVFILDPKGERVNWREDLKYLGDKLNVIEVTSDKKNKGLFDPFNIITNVNEAESMALELLVFLTGINAQSKSFPVLRDHIKKVASYENGRGMLQVIKELRYTDTEISNEIADQIESFCDLSVAGLLFGNGEETNVLKTDSVLNVLLVNDLVLPDADTEFEKYTLKESLSIAVLLVISTFALEFIKQDRKIFKTVVLDEAWAWLQVSEGKALFNKLLRTGRQLNSAIDFGTQNCDDIVGEKMKNNIGMKFAFRSSDEEEIKKTLMYFNLEYNESNVSTLRTLKNGECLMQDISGNNGILKVECVFDDYFEMIDTRPPIDVVV